MICPFLNLIFRRPGSYFFHAECSATGGIFLLKKEEASECCAAEEHEQCPIYLGRMSRLNQRQATGKTPRRKRETSRQESPA
jgi:hypothetical protein